MLGNATYRDTVHALCYICIQRHSRNCFLSMTMSGIELTNLYEHDAKNEEVRLSREVGCIRHTVARGGTLAWSLAALADKLVSLMSSSREAEWWRTVSKEEMSDCE